MIEWLILALSLAGLIISLYFTFAYYGRIKKSRWIPEILCAREGSSCVTVVQTPYARVFGMPNFLLGILYYAGLIIWLVLRNATWHRNHWMSYLFALTSLWILAASVVSVPVGIYLIYALRWKLRISCLLCYTVHAINLVLVFLLMVEGV